MTLFLTALINHLNNIESEKFEDEMEHNSTTACATAKPFTPVRSPRGRDNQKMWFADLNNFVTLFFDSLTT